MPIYEYRCSSCGHQQEALQKLSDPPLSVCAACGQATLSKMLTAAGFQLKGSGWCATDFRNQGAAKPKVADAQGDSKPAASAAKGETKTEAKTEAKPAASTESKSDKTGT